MPVNFKIFKTKHYIVIPENFGQTVQTQKSTQQENTSANTTEQVYPTSWIIFAKDNSQAGTFKFSEQPERGRINLEFDIDKITNREDLKLLFHEIIRCTFSIKDIFSVEVIFPETKEFKEIIDFLPYKKSFGENNSCIFHVNDTIFMSFYMIAGLLLGLGIGTLLSITGIGVLTGCIIGTILGFSLDNSNKKHRQMIEADLYPEELYKKYKKQK